MEREKFKQQKEKMRKHEVALHGPLTEKTPADDFLPEHSKEELPMAATDTYHTLLATQVRDYLLSPAGAQVKVSELEGKVVGLYFSANWYSPCHNFTPVLAHVYRELVGRGDRFEVVFVSSDEDSTAFNKFRSAMPWLAVPFSDLETKRTLSRLFNIEAIPSLVFLKPGAGGGAALVAQHDGVELVYRYGADAFPFSKERVEELEEEEREKHEKQTIVKLLGGHGRDYLLAQPSLDKVSVASLEGKTVGLYYSAQWCLPCLKFTPKLITVYNKIKQSLAEDKQQDFEIVLVSSDRDQASFTSYFSTMPWLALPFGDPTVRALARYFNVQAIPCLVIVGPDGKTLSMQGRKLINLHLERAYPFTQAQLKSLQEAIDEEAKDLPRSEYHEGHRHELSLVSEGSGGGPFICCACDEQGSGWAYLCMECGYEVHPRCVKSVNRSGDNC